MRSSLVRLVIPAIFAIAAAAILINLLIGAQNHFGAVSDLPEYYAASRMILEGNGASIYSLPALGKKENFIFPSLHGRMVGLYIPPFALVWLLPVGLVPVQIVSSVWLVVLAIALIASTYVLKRCVGFDLKFYFWLIAVLCLLGPLYEALRIGQLAPLILLGFSMCLLALKKGKKVLASIALSTLLLKPPELLPFLIFLAGAKRYKTILGLGLVSLFLFAVSLLLIGPNGYLNYLNLLVYSTENTQWMQPELNPTLRGQLLRIFPNNIVMVSVVSSVVCLMALVSIFVCGRKLADRKDWLEGGLACAMPLGLVTALHCHDYDLLLLLPLVVVLCKADILGRSPPGLCIIGILALIPFLLPFYVEIHYGYLLQGNVINPLFVLLAIFACMMWVAMMRLAK